MPISVQCPTCGRTFSIRDELEGKKVRCECGGVIVVEPSGPVVSRPPMAVPVTGPASRPQRPPTATPLGSDAYDVERPHAFRKRHPDYGVDDDDEGEGRKGGNPFDKIPGGKWIIIGPLILILGATFVRLALPPVLEALREVRLPAVARSDASTPSMSPAAGTSDDSSDSPPSDTSDEPAGQPVAEGPKWELPAAPYALASVTNRVSPDTVAIDFPPAPRFAARDGVLVADVMLNVPAGEPGSNGRLTIYKPSESTAEPSVDRKLPCVLVGPPGGSPIAFVPAPADADESDLISLAKSGHVVVAFHFDGELTPADNTPERHALAAQAFLASQAGLVNARNALDFVLARLSDVDPNAVFIAGRRNSGTLALLFAEHEPRLRGCIAWGGTPNVVLELQRRAQLTGKQPDADEMLVAERLSPATHAAKLSCPVSLVSSSADDAAMHAFQQQLQTLQKTVTLVVVPETQSSGPAHPEEMAAANTWISEVLHPRTADQRGKGRAKPHDGAPVVGGAREVRSGERNFRLEAVQASRLHRSKAANSLLLADVLLSSDTDLLGRVRWSPALKRPAAQLHWGFGVELNGMRSKPANLRAPGAVANLERDPTAEWRLSEELRKATGEIGVWLAEGLKHRVDAGSFGDWVVEERRGDREHRGIVLFDFAPVSQMLTDARTQNVDVLLAHVLTQDEGRTSMTLVVQLYDVSSGEKIWESKPVSSTRLAAGRRQGKNLEADFAEEVLKAIDDQIVLRDMPELSPAQVRSRLKAIRSRSLPDQLMALVELRYYQLDDLLSREATIAEVAELLDVDEAKAFCSDDVDARRKVVEQLAPEKR